MASCSKSLAVIRQIFLVMLLQPKLSRSVGSVATNWDVGALERESAEAPSKLRSVCWTWQIVGPVVLVT